MLEALVANCVYSEKLHATDAEKALADLIACETQQALDPAISLEARQLVSSFSEELRKWKDGDWCDTCNAPQMVLPDGEHRCMKLSDLQNAYSVQLKANQDLTKQLRRAAARISELELRLGGSHLTQE